MPTKKTVEPESGSEPEEVTPEPVALATEYQSGGEPESYVRVNISQQAKGFRYETTVTVSGVMEDAEMAARVQSLLMLSGQAARAEIENRENAEDAYRSGGAIGRMFDKPESAAPSEQSIDDIPF